MFALPDMKSSTRAPSKCCSVAPQRHDFRPNQEALNCSPETAGAIAAAPSIEIPDLTRVPVHRLEPRLQATLTIGAVNDPLEQEADRAADRVMRMDDPGISRSAAPAISRKCMESEDEERGLQRKATGGEITSDAAPPIVDAVLTSPGRALDPATHDFMASRFGTDFSDVRIHTDSAAGQSAKSIDARAYTLGNDIVFGDNEYRPELESGKRLLAHELAHVRQASTGKINRQTIYRQPAGKNSDLAAIEYEIQMLRMIPVKVPIQELRLAQLLQQRVILLARGASAPSAQTMPKQPSPAPAGNTNAQDKDFFEQWGDMRQLDRDQIERDLDSSYFGMLRQSADPIQPAPSASETGCHADPHTRPGRESVTCGYKRPDAATHAAMKAMQAPAPDFSEFDREQRAMLDRLNAAHLEWARTGKARPTVEFSPYEIEKDNVIPLYKRWELFEKRPDDFYFNKAIEYYFRANGEYQQELERRILERSFKDRIASARLSAQSSSGHWYNAKEALERLTGEELWRIGIQEDLFIESEKERVYKEQGSYQEYLKEKREERQTQARRNFEIERQNRWEAQGDQLRSPAMFIQPFAFGAFGPVVAAAYGGSQTGMMVGEAYNECASGSSGDCAAALVPIAGSVLVHQVTKPSVPVRPTRPISNSGNVVSVLENELTPPRTAPTAAKAATDPLVGTVGKVDVTGGEPFPPETRALGPQPASGKPPIGLETSPYGPPAGEVPVGTAPGLETGPYGPPAGAVRTRRPRGFETGPYKPYRGNVKPGTAEGLDNPPPPIPGTSRPQTREVTAEEQHYGMHADWRKVRRATPPRDFVPASEKYPVIEGQPDPALPGMTVTGPAQADHIIAVNTIRKKPGFAYLDDARQLEVLNMPENFVPLSPAANRSKGGKSFTDWIVHAESGTKVDPHFRQDMIDLAGQVDTLIDQRIDRLVREQMAERTYRGP